MLINISFPARVARVPVVGSVTLVVPVVAKVNGFAPVVVKASAKLMVFAFGIVNVPVVLVTVKPDTFSALKAYGTAANLTLVLKFSPLNVMSRYRLSSLKSSVDGIEVVDPRETRNTPLVTATVP